MEEKEGEGGEVQKELRRDFFCRVGDEGGGGWRRKTKTRIGEEGCCLGE